MIELEFLGGGVLRGADGALSGPAARRHPRALLALLATAPSRSLSRLKVVGLLWPEIDEATGRNRLTSILYDLRQAMGADALPSASGELRLDATTVVCDVWRFHEALDRDDLEGAVALYRGPFLDGFYLDDAADFAERVELERHRLHRAWREAVQTLAQRAGDEGRHRRAARWWHELAAADPLDTWVASGLIWALAAAGSRGAALRVADDHALRLREEFGAEPGEAFLRLVERVRAVPPADVVDLSAGGFEARPALAVLPFETLGTGGDPAFGEGVYSGILTRMSEIEGLSVIARTSVQRFRRSDAPASVIGGELGARWLLEGDVQTSGRRFEVNVRLVEAAEDRQIWARAWGGEFSAGSFFGVQAEVAGEIVDALPLSTSPGERLLLGQQPTGSLEAYRLTARGRMHLGHRSREEMERGLACFEEALALDPDYAPAWVESANALGLLHVYGHMDASVLSRAEEAIRTALDRNPRSAEAHAAMGRLLGQHNRATDAARHLRRAVELQPSYAEAHSWATVGHTVSGRPGEALRSARRAVTLDPLSPETIYNLGMSLLINDRPDEALKEARRARDLEPSYDSARLLEGIVLHEIGCFEEALGVLDGLVVPWVGSGTCTVAALSRIGLGDVAGARALLLEVRAAGHPFDEGLILAALGESEAAFEALGRARFDGLAFAESYWPTVALRYLFGRVWKGLRADPRHAALARRMDEGWGLEEGEASTGLPRT